MTNAFVIIILLALLAITVATYSRLGDIRNNLEQQGDSLTGTLYKLTEVRNNANDAGKKSAAALESIHERLKGIREKLNFIHDDEKDMGDDIKLIVGDVGYIKSLYENAANEAERVRAEEGKEPEPEPQSEPEQENEPATETEPVEEPEPEPEPAPGQEPTEPNE